MKPRSINIFLLDGDPNGIKVAQIAMSTIQAIAFRRNQLRRVRDTFPEIERPGVYILIGPDETEPDRWLGYVGESEGVGSRLATHSSNDRGKDSKIFWTDTVVLVSKDENLTKSHARYIESCLIRAVGGNPRWKLPNSESPSGIIWFSDIAFGACGERTPSAGRRARCGSGIPSPWPTVGSG